MKQLFCYANAYLKESDWRDLALIKFCLAAVGVLLGLAVPTKKKKLVCFGAVVVFLATWIPLMKKLWLVILKTDCDMVE